MSESKSNQGVPKLDRYRARKFVPNNTDLSNPDNVRDLYNKLIERKIDSDSAFEEFILDRSELESAAGELGASLYIDMTCQTQDADRSSAYQKFTTEIIPVISELSHSLDEKFVTLAQEFKIDKDRYLVYSRNKKSDIEIFRQENIDLSTQISLLSQEYQKVSGAMTAEFLGEEQTLVQIGTNLLKTDRSLRENAWKTITNRRLQDAEKIDELFDDMLKLRKEVARNAGFENFRDYMFKAYHRFDYNADDCKEFHETVAEVVMPIVKEMNKKRKEKMNLKSLRPWDMKVDPLGADELKPFSKTQDLINGTKNIFNKLDKDLGAKFATMESLGLLDLENRKGKAPGGYQSTLSEARKPFIFMNAVGTDQDMRTLLHESGHAFHAFESASDDLLDYRHAPMEFCEVASMSMELLANDYIGEFYNEEDAKRSTRNHLEQVIDILPWVATIDKFQHWIYESKENSRQTRSEMFAKIYDEFGGNLIDYSGLEREKQYLWHRQLHIFEVPFYYIEYAIAQLGALGIWLNAKTDKASAMRDYKKALALGGSRPLPELFDAANIKFDFSKKTIKPLMDAVAQEL